MSVGPVPTGGHIDRGERSHKKDHTDKRQEIGSRKLRDEILFRDCCSRALSLVL
jgi:hypothetical protein